jgi:uncharacterized protein YdcH (DUF465 family)
MEGAAGDPPIAVAAEPRIFGVVPPTVALVLGAAAVLAGAVAGLWLGAWPVGAGLIVTGVLLLALAIDAARRWPASALAQGAVGAVDGAGARLGLARVFAGAWSEATREVVRFRRELHELRRERERAQFELGGAAYLDEADEMRSLRDRIGELDSRIEAAEREMDAAVDLARRRIKRERVAIKPTRAIAVEEPKTGTTDVHPRHR